MTDYRPWAEFPFRTVLDGLQDYCAHMAKQRRGDFDQRRAVTDFLCGAGHVLNVFEFRCITQGMADAEKKEVDAGEVLDALRAEVEQLLEKGAKQ